MTQTTRWTDEFLNKKRLVGDPHADRAATALFQFLDGRSRDEVHAYIKEFISRDFTGNWKQLLPGQDPPELVDFFERFDDFDLTPEEIQMLEKGAKFFQVYGPTITLGLALRSLLKQYAHTKAIEVLRMTTLLEKFVNRRILETMQFVIDVMAGTWIDPDNGKLNLKHPGIFSIKKLRLLHAMIRYRILHKQTPVELGEYDQAHFGYPINQEDMVFALHTFSIETIQALQEMKENLTNEQIEDYYQCWRIIGRSLGIDRDLEPSNYADGLELQNKIYQRHFTLPNTTGPKLAKALQDWFVETIPFVKHKTFLTFAKAFNGRRNEKILSDHLGLDISGAHEDLILHIEEDLSMTIEEKSLLEETHHKKVLDNFFIGAIRSLIKSERGGKGTTFNIGDGFEAAWNLNEYGKPRTKFDLMLDAVIDLLGKIITLFRGKKKFSTESQN